MNNIQIAHLIVKALNHDYGSQHFHLNQKNKKQLIAKTPASDRYRKGITVPLTYAIQVLTPLIKDPAKCFHHRPENNYSWMINKTIKYFLEYGA